MYTETDVDNFLEHHGIKGMKWGVHRARSSQPAKVRVAAKPGGRVKTKGGTGQKPHEDAVHVAIARQKAKKSSTDALSTKDLKHLVERMNLEKQYSQLQPPSRHKKATKFVSDILLNAGKQQATRVAGDVMAKQVGNLLGGVVKVTVK